MTLRARLLLGLLISVATAGVAFATEEAAEQQVCQPAPDSIQEGNQSEPDGNGLAATDAPASPAQRAADVTPTSWGNVKALWG